MSKYLPKKILIMIYYTLIYSKLNYGIILWGGAKKEFIMLLKKLQNRFLRIYSNSCYYESVSHLYQVLNILKIENIYSLQLGTLIFKLRNGAFDKLIEKFSTFNSIHTYKTRHINDYILPRVKFEKSKQMISFKAIYFWNSLPVTIKGEQSIYVFKNVLIHYLQCNT